MLWQDQVHPQWKPLLAEAWQQLDPAYIRLLQNETPWLPGPSSVFAAFTQPLASTRYILFGESPYPRSQSANGYAFWDASVNQLWSPTGLSTSVNRATSLRNFIKMLLYARGDLHLDFSQAAIARLDHQMYVQTLPALFKSLLAHGFLLLNASLVYREGLVRQDVRCWQPFMVSLLDQLAQCAPTIQCLLLGRWAQLIPHTEAFSCLKAMHPYQLSFITAPNVVSFFKPFNLLDPHEPPNQH